MSQWNATQSAPGRSAGILTTPTFVSSLLNLDLVRNFFLGRCRYLHVFRKNNEGQFTFGNDVLLKLLNVTFDQFHLRRDEDFFPESLALHYRNGDESARNGVVTVEEEIQLKGHTEKIRILTIKAQAVDLSGKPVGTQGIFWKESEHQLAQQELCELLFRMEHQFRDLLQATPDIVCHHDENLKLRYLNPAAERALGWSSQDLRDKDIWELLDQSLLANSRRRWYQRLLWKSLHTGQLGLEDVQLRIPLRTKSGERVRLAARLVPLGMLHGKHHFWLIGRMVESKSGWQYLDEESLTPELMGGYAKIASTSILGQDVVHNLKRHLTHIQTVIPLLHESVMGGRLPDTTMLIQNIESYCEDFRREADAFLSKVTQEGLQSEPNSLNHVVYRIHRCLAPPAPVPTIRVFERRDTNLPRANFDDFVFLQAAIALAENARRETPSRGCIYLETGFTDDTAWLAIKSESRFPKKVLRVWKERSLGGRMPSKQARAGMGLYFAHRILDLHGGTLEIKNELDSQTNTLMACARMILRRA